MAVTEKAEYFVYKYQAEEVLRRMFESRAHWSGRGFSLLVTLHLSKVNEFIATSRTPIVRKSFASRFGQRFAHFCVRDLTG
jgi:hypothetical protein